MVCGGSTAGESLRFWARGDNAMEELNMGGEASLKKSKHCSLRDQRYGPGTNDMEKAQGNRFVRNGFQLRPE